jgi:hypothetical protein
MARSSTGPGDQLVGSRFNPLSSRISSDRLEMRTARMLADKFQSPLVEDFV